MTMYNTSDERILAAINLAAMSIIKRLESGEAKDVTPDELASLRAYSGWGHSAKIFDHTRPKYSPANREVLGSLASDEQIKELSKSIMTAYYTPRDLVRLIWGAVEHLGLKSRGSVIDAGAGHGVFFQEAPDIIGDMVAVECEPFAAKVMQYLVPHATVINKRLQDSAEVKSGAFDVAIGNVPFADYGVSDPTMPKVATTSLHNYFIARLVDSLRDGGIAALITSRFTLDAAGSGFREYLAESCDLVGAIRLPTVAFKDAGAEVTSDILFLRKRDNDVYPSSPWVATGKGMYYGESYTINQYFIDNPQMIIGKLELRRGRFGKELRCVYSNRDYVDYTSRVELAMAKLPRDVMSANTGNICAVCGEPRTFRSPCKCQRSADIKIGDKSVRSGAFFVQDGTLYINNAGEHNEVGLSTAAADRVKRMVSMRDLAREVLACNFGEDVPLKAAQRRLLWQWRMFKSKYGAINKAYNRSLFSKDPDAPLLWSIEDFDARTGASKTTEFFTKRVIGAQRVMPTSCASSEDALVVSLAETGGIDWDLITSLTGFSRKKSMEDLKGIVYQHGIKWYSADEYLSGNVRVKLEEARKLVDSDPSYEYNVKMLEEVMPEPLKPGEIVAPLSAGWIPPSIVADFVSQMSHGASFLNGGTSPTSKNMYSVDARYAEYSAAWTLVCSYAVSSSGHMKSVWGTNRVDGVSLITSSLNGKHVVVKDKLGDSYVINRVATMEARAMQRAIKDRFKDWVWEDVERGELLAEVYNRKFRSHVVREYDGSHLSMIGLGATMPTPHAHQKNMAWRVCQGGNHMLWWSTGFGKTLGMIFAGAELRRLGLRKKVVFTTLSNVLWDFATWYQRAYPLARILVIDSRDMAPKKRQEMIGRMATQDWDAIIMTHEAFAKIPVRASTFSQLLEMEIAALEDSLWEADEDRATIKDINKQVARLEKKLKDSNDSQNYDEGSFYFEDIGVDALFVDEAHLFKNLFFATKRTRVPGISNSDSARAFDMFVKCQYVSRRDTDGNLLGMRERTNRFGAGVVQGSVIFATATPIPNSVCEMYTMQRYLQTDRLIGMGLVHFDSWANTFGEDVTMIEMRPTGVGFRENTRFVRFNNVGELMRIFLDAADIQCDRHKVNIKMPDMETGGIIPVVSPMTPDLEDFIDDCAERMKAIESGTAPDKDNILVIMGDANKAATDMRLTRMHTGITYEEIEEGGYDMDRDPLGKVQMCIDNLVEIYDETTGVDLYDDDGDLVSGGPFNLTQMVFLDTATYKGKKKWSLYNDILEGLVAADIPAEEVAFAHTAKNDSEKKVMFDAMNTGELRILIGSTSKMGMGTNAQRLLYAEHNLDPTWRPADEEQRIGRIERQGNLCQSIRVYRYVTEGSFDVYMYQTLEAKAGFLAQLMHSTTNTRTIEDVDSAVVTYAQFKALATGNPLILERTEIETKLRSMEMMYEAWESRVARAKYELLNIPERIERLDKRLSQYNLAASKLSATENDKFKITFMVHGTDEVMTKRQPAAAVFKTYTRRMSRGSRHDGFARMRGCNIDLYASRGRSYVEIHFFDDVTIHIELGGKGVGDIRRIENAFSAVDHWRSGARQSRVKLLELIPANELVVESKFQLHDEYTALRSRLAEIIAELEAEFGDDDEDDIAAIEAAKRKSAPVPPEPKENLSAITAAHFNVMSQMTWRVGEADENGRVEAFGTLPYQLDPKDYRKIDKHLADLGGVWWSDMESHYFHCDPRKRISSEFQFA